MKNFYSKYLFLFLAVLCMFPFVTAPFALMAGVIYALLIGNPYIDHTRKYTHKLLQYSVIGLGFGMNAAVALQAGKNGFIYTIVGICATFLIGFIISLLLKTDRKMSYLIFTGTAICGGSAIAAVAPVIEAKHEQTSVALGTVFILNSIALILFPFVGHLFHLSQIQFGIWSAIAIHDTSSVVGAASHYGNVALETATTIKLTRALWIIPVTLISSYIFKSEVKKIKIPWFIVFFFLAMVVNTFFSNFIFGYLYNIARQGLVLTLFLIGSNISRETLKNVGFKPLLLGVLLWILISIGSFLFI